MNSERNPPSGHSGGTDTVSAAATTSNSNSSARAVWDPDLQIYVDGVVPEQRHVREWLLSLQQQQEQGRSAGVGLWVFGYGSLCWNPGQDGDTVLASPRVGSRLGLASGYRRCWAQKSTDHRGVPDFPGIVCTLLKEEEVEAALRERPQRGPRRLSPDAQSPMGTMGRVYLVPSDMIDPCLNELDFREKGGYARDVIDVALFEEEEENQGVESGQAEKFNAVQALLYRGTMDNPAIWQRALTDLTLAAGKESS
jgi:cation transport regulator ChaC